MKKTIIILIGFVILFYIHEYKKQNQKEITEIQNTSYHPEESNFREDTHIHDDHVHDDEHLENETIEKNYENKKIINFTLKTIKGEKFTLKDLKGKKVFLNFWTTWCPPCQEEMPQIERFYQTYGKTFNVEVVAVNITDQDSGVDVIKEFVDYYQLTFPIVLDEKGDVSKKYKVLTIPTSFIIDEKGNIIKEIIGPVTEQFLLDYFK